MSAVENQPTSQERIDIVNFFLTNYNRYDAKDYLLAHFPVDDLTCSICLRLFKDPVTLHCGHSFCRSCLSGCENLKCPIDRKPIPSQENEPLSRSVCLSSIVDNLPTKCPASCNEHFDKCTSQLKNRDFDDHVLSCPHITFQCLCKKILTKKDFFDPHSKCDCEPISCEMCNEKVVPWLFSLHEYSCEKMPGFKPGEFPKNVFSEVLAEMNTVKDDAEKHDIKLENRSFIYHITSKQVPSDPNVNLILAERALAGAFNYFTEGNFELALCCVKKSLEFFSKASHLPNSALLPAIFITAQILKERQHLEQVYKLLKLGFGQLVQPFSHTDEMSKSYLKSLSELSIILERYEEAYGFALSALELHKHEKDVQYAKILNHLSQISNEMTRTDEAIKYAEECAVVLKPMEEQQQYFLLKTYNNLVQLYWAIEDDGKVKDNAETCISLLKKYPALNEQCKEILPNALMMLARIYSEDGFHFSAKSYLEECVAAMKKSGVQNSEELQVTLLHLAQTELQLSNFDEAERAAKECLELVRTLDNSPSKIQRILKLLEHIESTKFFLFSRY